ncbi:hypothetical protein [Nocardioides pakistanensis]
MTYGDVASRLRETMTWLLERHRITQQLGGPGSFRIPVTTTEADRLAMGEEIQHYRAAVLTYCLEAVRAATPTADLDGKDRLRDPAVALRYQLELARSGTPADAQLSSLMRQRSRFELVSHWQDAARIAIEGEREIAAVRHQPLSWEQQAQLLKDAADLTRGLVVLDIRYKNVPGWRFLEQKRRVLTAATAVSEGLRASDLDASVDHLGWRPTPGIIEGPALPGLAGVLQAQHNASVDLSHFPSAFHLRHVLVAQADLSQQSARLAVSVGSSTTASFQERAALYRELVVASRPLGGQLGAGQVAAVESANAARRMASGPADGEDVERALAKLMHLSGRVDVKIAAAVEHGFRENLYFVAIKLPTLGRPGPDGIVRAAQKHIPVHEPAQSILLELSRERLRPAVAITHTSAGDGRTPRAVFEATIARSTPSPPAR